MILKSLFCLDCQKEIPFIMNNVLLSMKNIKREFQVGDEKLCILKGIDLDICEGEFLAILGPSGSGKSTLMNIIGCLDTPSSGEYYLRNQNIAQMNEKQLSEIRNKEIGFIFQSYFLLNKLDAMENVKVPLFYAGMERTAQNERAKELLEKVGLADRLHFLPKQLSGGLQQRVAIARALANHPSILLADEPTGALDQKTGKQIIELFHELNEEGVTIIIITHDAGIASHAKRIVKILDGNLSEGEVEDA